MADIVVAGSLNMDLVAVTPRIPAAGETIIGSKFFTNPGGKGANQAYAAAKLGGSVAMLGRVGDDDFGRAMRANLADVGCDVTAVRTVAGPSGVALIFVSAHGENSIVVAPGANALLLVEEIAGEAKLFEGCKVILLQLETPLETVTAIARLGKRIGALVVLDPAPAQPLPDELLRSIDVLTPNETEAAILTGTSSTGIAGKLQEMGPRTVILKLGERGCLLANGGGPVAIRAPQVKVVDTTAAGDVFNGALAVGLSEGRDLKSACEFAVKAAALSVTRMGAQSSAPSREEVAAAHFLE